MSQQQKAITAQGISKSYKISQKLQKNAHPTIKDEVSRMLRKPLEFIGAKGGKDMEDFWALKDVNFEINKGDVVGIMGPNGSGKSTLFKILSRITQPTKGEIVIHGKVASLLEVGTGFHNELTGRENVYFNGAILGMKKTEIDAKFDEIVAFSEIEKFIDTPVKFYSSGMRVRLAFSVAAHLDPEILIIDEVLAVGDVAFKQKSLERMKQIAEGGTTVLFVSHIINQIEKICTRGILLSHGEVVYDGDLDETIDKYLELNHVTEDIDGDDTGGDRPEKEEVSGGGELEISNVKTSVKTGKTAPSILVDFDVRNHTKNSFNDLWVGITIDTMDGKRVSVINNTLTKQKMDVGPDGSHMRFEVCDVSLNPDEYVIGIAVHSNVDLDIIYHRVRKAAQLTIPNYSLINLKKVRKNRNLPPVVFDFKIDQS